MDDLKTVLRLCKTGNPGTMLELSRGECDIGLRHDMDGEYLNALNLAKWENAHGLRSTYYVLHAVPYWTRSKADVLRVCHAIADLGHEVSLHNDTIGASLASGGDAFELLESLLAELRAEGFPCLGTAAHGSTEAHEAGLCAYDMFAEVGGPKTFTFRGRVMGLNPRPMSDFGLEYEAYHVPRAHYLSDNGGRWNIDPETLYGRAPGNLVILQHPCHWRVP